MRGWERISAGRWQNGVWEATQVHSKKWRVARLDGAVDPTVDEFHPSLAACKDAVKRLVPILTHDEVVKLARDIVTNVVYFANNEHGLQAFEMLVALGAFLPFEDDEILKVCGLYAPMHSAAPYAVNGQPRFLEMRMLHQDNEAELFEELRRMEDALGIVHPPDPDTDQEEQP